MNNNSGGRLRRYVRTEKHVPVVVTERDRVILQAVESYRLLSSEQIQALMDGSAQNVLRRLRLLFHAGYLDRLKPRFTEGGGSNRMVYGITNRGVAYLLAQGLIHDVPKTDRNAGNASLRETSVEHRLLISHVRTIFAAACRATGGPVLLSWREGRELQDKVDVRVQNSYIEIPVAPDGFIAVEQGGFKLYFFVEADRGTMPIKRFVQKLRAYAEYWKQKRQREKLGIEQFRVLTVAQSEIRCQNLAHAAERAGGDVLKFARLFLFAAEKDLPLSSPESVFNKIWRVPTLGERIALLGEARSKNLNKEGFVPMKNGSAYQSEVRYGP